MSSNVSSVSDVLGRRVVAVEDAEEIGEVKAFVLDRSGSAVRRLHVAGRKRSAELVDWNDIESVGADAVMVGSARDVSDSSREVDDEFVKGDIEILGARVLDTAGYAVGEVTDLHFDAVTGEVVAAMTDEGRIDASRIRALGTYALVVDSA